MPYHVFFKSKLIGPLLGNVFMSAIPVPSSHTYQTGYLVQIMTFVDYDPQQHKPRKLDMDGKWSLNSFMLASS
jgi:hypothetical protein